jgi:hypothetical protein
MRFHTAVKHVLLAGADGSHGAVWRTALHSTAPISISTTHVAALAFILNRTHL